MTVLFKLLALFATLPAQAEDPPPAAPAVPAMNLQHCRPNPQAAGIQPGTNETPAYSLTDAGGLNVDTKHPSVAGYERKPDGTEKVILSATNAMTPGVSYRQTVTLRKADGRPDTIEQEIDQVKERKLLKHLGFGPKAVPAAATMGHRFEYDKDGSCHVKQVYMKDKAGKEFVAYDRELCRELLAAAKKMGKEKAKECQEAFGSMWRAIQGAANRLKAEGKELQTELGFFFPHASAGSADQSFTHLLVAGRCQNTLAIYGEAEIEHPLAQTLSPELVRPTEEPEEKVTPAQ